MRLKEIGPYLFSPALPATALLFGMVFCLACFHFAGLRWHPAVTITLYSGLLVWVALLAWCQRKVWGGFGMLDAIFGVFTLWVLGSLLIQGAPDSAAWKYGRYLPFLVITPYLCGRLIRAQGMHVFFRIVALAGAAMLLLLVIDYSQRLAAFEVYSRWPFFGHDFSVLPIAVLLAASQIVLTFFFLTGKGKRFRDLSWRQILGLFMVGLIAEALVAVAARGALFAGMTGTLCVLLMTRHWPLFKKTQFVLYLIVAMSSAYLLLPKPQTQVYADLMTMPAILTGGTESTPQVGSPTLAGGASTSAKNSNTSTVNSATPAGNPGIPTEEPTPWEKDPVVLASTAILGAASCTSIERGVNSVAIRWTLYQEAGAMFMHNPLWGVGAASFGRHSCTGEMGFPHSTIIQSLAELGIVGGVMYGSLLLIALIAFARKAFTRTANPANAAAQVSLALFVMYLVTDQLYGNYFMAAGTYFFAGVAAGMQSNPMWNDACKVKNA